MRTNSGCIICNHDLLIEDLSRYGRKLMKEVEVVVCDEAHNLESKVRSANTIKIEFRNITGILGTAISFLNRKNNYEHNLDKIKNNIKLLDEQIDKNVLKKIKELQEQLIMLEDCNGLPLEFDDTVTKLSKTIYNDINGIVDSLSIVSDTPVMDDLYEQIMDRSDVFSRLSKGNDSSWIYWIERRNNRNHIYSAPKNIDVISNELFFKKQVFKESKTFIFTSATLTPDGENYDYFKHNIGAGKVENGEDIFVDESFESPYNYDENALLYCPTDISNPKDKNNYLIDITKKIEELINLTNGKTMVLFTSKYDMNYVYNKLKDSFKDIDVYVQNDGSSQNKVKEQFKSNINSVLFSTGIFWEGIDIKGESLSNLIIARLPFPVVDPVMEYKKSCYKDGFDKVYIPEMLIKLKQGVGRLIRGYDDKGIVTILDSRLANNKNYLEKVRESLLLRTLLLILRILKNSLQLKKYRSLKNL